MAKKIRKVALIVFVIIISGFAIIEIGFAIDLLINGDTFLRYGDGTFDAYDMDVVGSVSLPENILDDYQLIDEYVVSNGQSNKDNKEVSYFLDNSFYSSNIETEEYDFYFCRKSADSFPFIYSVKKTYSEADYHDTQIYIKKDYELPNIYNKRVKSIILADCVEKKGDVITFATVYVDGFGSFKRVRTSDVKKFTDRDVIEKCVEQYKRGDDDFKFLIPILNEKKPFDYYVLAEFDDGVIYQFLGYAFFE